MFKTAWYKEGARATHDVVPLLELGCRHEALAAQPVERFNDPLRALLDGMRLLLGALRLRFPQPHTQNPHALQIPRVVISSARKEAFYHPYQELIL